MSPTHEVHPELRHPLGFVRFPRLQLRVPVQSVHVLHNGGTEFRGIRRVDRRVVHLNRHVQLREERRPLAIGIPCDVAICNCAAPGP